MQPLWTEPALRHFTRKHTSDSCWFFSAPEDGLHIHKATKDLYSLMLRQDDNFSDIPHIPEVSLQSWHPGHRVSWPETVGGVPKRLCFDTPHYTHSLSCMALCVRLHIPVCVTPGCHQVLDGHSIYQHGCVMKVQFSERKTLQIKDGRNSRYASGLWRRAERTRGGI